MSNIPSITIVSTPDTNLELLVEKAQSMRGPYYRPPFSSTDLHTIIANLALQPDPNVRALFRGISESLPPLP